jgi:diphthamide synthase (EF-2-diphthine--ammonia ligase)
MIKSGLRAKLTCVDPKCLAPEFVGREFDERLLSELPLGIDPCGENGEFHTFVYAGPMLAHSLSVKAGEIVSRDGFVFPDLNLAQNQNKDMLTTPRTFGNPCHLVSVNYTFFGSGL